MQKALFRSSFLAVCLAVAAPVALAGEAEKSGPVTKSEEAEIIDDSRTRELISLVRNASDLLDGASKAVLAGKGDRETAAARRDAAAWMAKAARMVKADMSALEKAEEEFVGAKSDQARALETARKAVATEAEAFRLKLAELEKDPKSEAVKASLPTLRAAAEKMDEALAAFESFRSVSIEIDFTEIGATPETFDMIVRAIISAAEGQSVTLVPFDHDLAVRLVLTGEAPARMTAGELRIMVMTALEQLEISKAIEATAPTLLPKPVFMGITLD